MVIYNLWVENLVQYVWHILDHYCLTYMIDMSNYFEMETEMYSKETDLFYKVLQGNLKIKQH